MFYEGSEKKTELIVDCKQLNLLTDIDTCVWKDLVNACNAKILSSIENKHCRAYLLSESSLFIWKDRLLIITCGITQLVNSAIFFFEKYGINVVEHFIYQRKNEYFSHAQSSNFGQDAKRLQNYLSGKAFRFGNLDSHHNYLFQLNNNVKSIPTAKTYELTTYQISDRASAVLTNPKLTASDVRKFLQLKRLIPGFTLDDFVFEPFGYSLNAIKDKWYFTIHVTPQRGSSYISFESNINLLALVPIILEVLAPNAFDLLTFNETNFDMFTAKYIDNRYTCQSNVTKHIKHSYQVNFAHYILPQSQATSPIELALDEDFFTL
ncbi:adenosylmethionine decarboxylase [Thalassotalea hakodatensis]|uniref:adenosylmethionine decarboxylase n=1 Tax=Thalassotalea hakodatensis TaxID=3030492 RepID=UPI002572C3B8|nr:adenosylmethionine decarboxylase [Thalassotalea hakodatensis]